MATIIASAGFVFKARPIQRQAMIMACATAVEWFDQSRVIVSRKDRIDIPPQSMQLRRPALSINQMGVRETRKNCVAATDDKIRASELLKPIYCSRMTGR
jgi:hypothetical protein